MSHFNEIVLPEVFLGVVGGLERHLKTCRNISPFASFVFLSY
jgi:hypothetical protein